MQLIESLAHNLYHATLVGNPAPAVEALGLRMRNPQPGDLVVEQSTQYMADRVGTRLGKLVRVTREPMFTSEEWYAEGGAGPDEPIPTERVWYLELSDGREFRWVNASFIAVPTNILGYNCPFASDPSILRAR